MIRICPPGPTTRFCACRGPLPIWMPASQFRSCIGRERPPVGFPTARRGRDRCPGLPGDRSRGRPSPGQGDRRPCVSGTPAVTLRWPPLCSPRSPISIQRGARAGSVSGSINSRLIFPGNRAASGLELPGIGRQRGNLTATDPATSYHGWQVVFQRDPVQVPASSIYRPSGTRIP